MARSIYCNYISTCKKTCELVFSNPTIFLNKLLHKIEYTRFMTGKVEHLRTAFLSRLVVSVYGFVERGMC